MIMNTGEGNGTEEKSEDMAKLKMREKRRT